MIVVVYSAPADKKGERSFVYGPFETTKAAQEWIKTKTTEFFGSRSYVTTMTKPKE